MDIFIEGLELWSFSDRLRPVLRQTQRVDDFLLQDEEGDQAGIHLTGARIEGTLVEGTNEALIRDEPPRQVSRLITKAGQRLNKQLMGGLRHRHGA